MGHYAKLLLAVTVYVFPQQRVTFINPFNLDQITLSSDAVGYLPPKKDELGLAIGIQPLKGGNLEYEYEVFYFLEQP